MAAVAVIAMIAPVGQAAASVCGGFAPRETECAVEGFVVTTDNPVMQVSAPLFLGVVTAEMKSDTGSSSVLCSYILDAEYSETIRATCHTKRVGTIYRDQTVSITAKATGKPSQIPAVGNWSVLYAASN
jgi:hypothetical protein